MPRRGTIKLISKTLAQIDKEERARRQEYKRISKMMPKDYFKNINERESNAVSNKPRPFC